MHTLKTRRIFFILSLLVLSVHLTLAKPPPTPPKVGGYTPIKVDDHVRSIAEFAVAQHNKNNGTNLELVSIISAESQVVSGTNYRLVIATRVKGGFLINNYETVVYEGLPGVNPGLKLTSFTLKTLLGGFSPIPDVNDPNVRFIAEFAVHQHNKLAKDKLELVRIREGQSQVVAGTNYKLIISAKGKHDKSYNIYETVVFEGLPTVNPILKLVSFKPLLLKSKN